MNRQGTTPPWLTANGPAKLGPRILGNSLARSFELSDVGVLQKMQSRSACVSFFNFLLFCFPFILPTMIQSPFVLRAIELLLCLWVIGSQIWYLAQFRPLVEFAARRIFHRG
jgi:hypothetical protein